MLFANIVANRVRLISVTENLIKLSFKVKIIFDTTTRNNMVYVMQFMCKISNTADAIEGGICRDSSLKASAYRFSNNTCDDANGFIL